jgi:hypothetical protein
MLESSIVSNNNIAQFATGDYSLITLIISLSIFSFLVIRSRSSIKTFQSQMLLFIVLYLVGEIIENINFNKSLPLSDLGSQIHVAATVFLIVSFWSRYYSSERHDIQMIDHEQYDDEGIDKVPKDSSDVNK